MALSEERLTKNYDSQFLLVQVYVDDIIFGSTNEILCEDFSKLMQTEFGMSMMKDFSCKDKKSTQNSIPRYLFEKHKKEPSQEVEPPKSEYKKSCISGHHSQSFYQCIQKISTYLKKISPLLATSMHKCM